MNKTVTYKVDLNKSPVLSEEQKARLEALAGVVSGNGKYSTLRIFTPTSFNDIQHGIFA